jgi:hypothetical protein
VNLDLIFLTIVIAAIAVGVVGVVRAFGRMLEEMSEGDE